MSCTTIQPKNVKTAAHQTSKRLKLDSVDHGKSNMTILQVFDDCLVDIFMYLNTSDLLNVRASDGRFKVPTDRAFIRKHLNIPVIVSNVNINVFEYSMNILQQFGHCITKLRIKFILEDVGRLLGAVATYAGDTTVKLTFYHEEEEWYMKLHRTGLRRIKRHLRELNTNFPNLRHLKFVYNDWVGCPYSDDIIQAIPTLMLFSATGVIFSHEDVDRFIALNGQLEHLSLWVPNGFITQSFINNLDASLPKLRSFKMNRITVEGTLDRSRPHRFNNLLKLTFGMFTAEFPVNGLSSLFGEEIEHLELYCYDYVITNLVNVVSQLRKLKKLILYLPPNVAVTSPESFDMSIVSPIGIRELILRNSQLTELEVDVPFKLTQFNFVNNKYRVFKEEMEREQWNVQVAQWLVDGPDGIFRIKQIFTKNKEH